jgi:hypothetical protein
MKIAASSTEGGTKDRFHCAMQKITVGIDASKDCLDVAVRPSGERFAVDRKAAGLEALVDRLKTVNPSHVVLEATGALEAVVVTALATGPGCRSRSPTPRKSARRQGH